MRRPTHTFLTEGEQASSMVTRRMKIRRRLRSARASALSEEARRQELREAEDHLAHGKSRDERDESAAAPRAADLEGASDSREAGAERAGVGEAD
jgi:hypothetical protein